MWKSIFLLFAGAVVALANPVIAGESNGESSAHKRQPNWERLADKLELSEGQTVEFVALMQSQHEQRKQIMEENGVHEKLSSLRQETREKLSSVLTEQQFESWEEHLQKRKMRKKGKHEEASS